MPGCIVVMLVGVTMLNLSQHGPSSSTIIAGEGVSLGKVFQMSAALETGEAVWHKGVGGVNV